MNPPLWGEEIIPDLRAGEDLKIYPVFPPRIRNDTPYLCVAYLQSAIWRGQVVSSSNGKTEIHFGGRSWIIEPNSRDVLVDGVKTSFAEPALLIHGYLYLPSVMIHGITGWHVDYEREMKTVYVYSRLAG